MCPKYKRNNRSRLLLFVLFPLFILTLFSFIFFTHEKTKEHHNEIKTAYNDCRFKKWQPAFLPHKLIHIDYGQQME